MNSRVIASARIVAAFLLAAMLFAAVACSGPKDEPEATPVPPAEEPTATPEAAPAAEAEDSPDGLEILKSSYERMSQVSSFATVIATEIRTVGQALNISTSVSRNVEGAMRILTTVQFPQGAQSTELFYDRTNDHAYVKVPGDDWRRTTPEALAELSGLDLKQYQVNFFAELIPPEDPPWDIYTVRYLGREEVEGAQTHHLGVTIDLQDLLSRLSESQGGLLLGSAGLSGAPLDVLEEARDRRRRGLDRRRRRAQEVRSAVSGRRPVRHREDRHLQCRRRGRHRVAHPVRRGAARAGAAGAGGAASPRARHRPGRHAAHIVGYRGRIPRHDTRPRRDRKAAGRPRRRQYHQPRGHGGRPGGVGTHRRPHMLLRRPPRLLTTGKREARRRLLLRRALRDRGNRQPRPSGERWQTTRGWRACRSAAT